MFKEPKIKKNENSVPWEKYISYCKTKMENKKLTTISNPSENIITIPLSESEVKCKAALKKVDAIPIPEQPPKLKDSSNLQEDDDEDVDEYIKKLEAEV